MSGFSPQWLQLRERYDRQARNDIVLAAVESTFREHSSIALVDLGCGTGATVRALSSRLPAHQNWRLIDNDLGLLARAADLARPPDLTLTPRPIDLARDLEFALDGPIDLITTSALLDLVSYAWVERLAVEAAVRRLPIYAALSCQGLPEIAPGDPLDEAVISAVTAHQGTDKGFGPALGIHAGERLVEALGGVGYEVCQGRSDWAFGPADREIQFEMVAWWLLASKESGEIAPEEIAGWVERRHAYIAAGRASMRIGHVDVFAKPMGAR
jgi:hypothetical protein